MEDKYIRTDLLRLGVVMLVMVGILIGLKIYDQSTNNILTFGERIFNGIIGE